MTWPEAVVFVAALVILLPFAMWLGIVGGLACAELVRIVVGGGAGLAKRLRP